MNVYLLNAAVNEENEASLETIFDKVTPYW